MSTGSTQCRVSFLSLYDNVPDVSLGKEITADSSEFSKWLIQTPSTTLTAVNLPISAVLTGPEAPDRYTHTDRWKIVPE